MVQPYMTGDQRPFPYFGPDSRDRVPGPDAHCRQVLDESPGTDADGMPFSPVLPGALKEFLGLRTRDCNHWHR